MTDDNVVHDFQSNYNQSDDKTLPPAETVDVDPNKSLWERAKSIAKTITAMHKTMMRRILSTLHQVEAQNPFLIGLIRKR